MVSPLTLNGKRVLSRSNTIGSKSVAFHLSPTEVLSRDFEKPKKGSSPKALQGNAKSIFKRAPFRLKLGFQDSSRRSKTTRAKSKDDTNSIEEEQEDDENPLHVTDSFQYRAEPILEGDDFIIDITHLKRNKGEPDQLIEPESATPVQKKFNIVTVKSKPIMRRKSDMSTWSGGVSELEKKTVFMTFEYIPKQIDLEEGYLNLKRSRIDSFTYRGTPSTRSGKSSVKFDASPKVMRRGFTQSISQQQDQVVFDFNIEKKDQKCIRTSSTPKPRKVKPKNQREDSKEGGIRRLRGKKVSGEMRIDDNSADEISQDYSTSRAKKGVMMNNLMQEYYQDALNNREILPTSFSKSKSTIKLQEYYNPLKLTRKMNLLIAPNLTGREQKADKISISTIIKNHQRDLGSGTSVSKTAQIEDDNNDTNIRIGGETTEFDNEDAGQRKSKKSSNLIKIHQTLVAKMHDTNERSTSRTKRLRENKTFLTNLPKNENESLSRESKDQLSRFPIINTEYGSFFKTKQNSIDREHTKSPYESTKKLKRNELAIFNGPAKVDISKSLKTERLAISEERVFKFKPKPPNLRKLVKKDGELTKKRMNGSQIRD